MDGNLPRLRRLLTERFSDDDLRNLCFDLGVDYEDLPGEAKGGKVRELLLHLDNRDCIDDLIDAVQKERPGVSWRDQPFTIPDARRCYLEAIVVNERFSRWAGDRYMDEQAALVLLDRPPSAIERHSRALQYSNNQALDLLDSVREMISTQGQVLVLGELGMGKSTLLEKLMYVYANEALQTEDVLPVCVPLSRFSDCPNSTGMQR